MGDLPRGQTPLPPLPPYARKLERRRQAEYRWASLAIILALGHTGGGFVRRLGPDSSWDVVAHRCARILEVEDNAWLRARAFALLGIALNAAEPRPARGVAAGRNAGRRNARRTSEVRHG